MELLAVNTQTRFINRMGDHVRTGDYGCSITCYEHRPDYAQRAVYLACAIGFVAALAACYFN